VNDLTFVLEFEPVAARLAEKRAVLQEIVAPEQKLSEEEKAQEKNVKAHLVKLGTGNRRRRGGAQSGAIQEQGDDAKGSRALTHSLTIGLGPTGGRLSPRTFLCRLCPAIRRALRHRSIPKTRCSSLIRILLTFLYGSNQANKL
jgi:hypothetical protein